MSRQKNQEGFSLLEMVVAMGILIVLVIGGILFYRGINQNSKEAAVQQAAKSVYTGAVANQSDNDGSTTPSSAAKEYNESQKDTITVDGVDRPVIYVTVDEFTDGGLKVKAVYGDDEAEHIIDTSKGGDPGTQDPGDGEVAPDPEKLVTDLLRRDYQCDLHFAASYGAVSMANGATPEVAYLERLVQSGLATPQEEEEYGRVMDAATQREIDSIPADRWAGTDRFRELMKDNGQFRAEVSPINGEFYGIVDEYFAALDKGNDPARGNDVRYRQHNAEAFSKMITSINAMVDKYGPITCKYS
jgi:type II secretory pathway pseudopilin PulG